MLHTKVGNAGVHLSSAWTEAEGELALEQLERILSSSHFRTSKRCSLFLRYIVEQASGNSVESLKERTLGVEVFDRKPQYDTNQDPVVRVAAGEVRKRLAQYYLEPEHESEPRITLPLGSYVPELHKALHLPEPSSAAAQPEPVPAADSRSESEPTAVNSRWRFGLWIAIAGSLVVAICAGLLLARGKKTELDSFWEPVLEPQGPVLVCLGQPKTYHFMTRTQAELDRWFGSNPEGRVPPDGLRSVPLEEFVPSWDRYISVHDAESFARLSSLFARSGKQASIRGGRSVSLADLRGRPVVLIGAFNNDWTLSLAGELRFYFDADTTHGEFVRDRQNPGKVEWTVGRSWPHRRIPLDYAVVTRVTNPVTERVVVIAAGITHFGTQAAGEFITNASYFQEAARNAPDGWQRKNMQVVLSAKVMSGTVGPPKVLAVHYW